jgi:hypothetical protein
VVETERNVGGVEAAAGGGGAAKGKRRATAHRCVRGGGVDSAWRNDAVHTGSSFVRDGDAQLTVAGTVAPWAELPAWLDGARGRGRGKLGSSIGRGAARTAPRGQGAAALDVAELERRGGGSVARSDWSLLKRKGMAGRGSRRGRSAERGSGGLGVDKARGRRRRAAGARGKTGEEEKPLTGGVRLLCW